MAGLKGDSAKVYGIPGLHVVDPEDLGLGSWCVSCDGPCEGHYTGRLTAVADENEEIIHWASSERAARRWARLHGTAKTIPTMSPAQELRCSCANCLNASI